MVWGLLNLQCTQRTAKYNRDWGHVFMAFLALLPKSLIFILSYSYGRYMVTCNKAALCG